MNWYKKAQLGNVVYDTKTIKELTPPEIKILKSLHTENDLAPLILEDFINPRFPEKPDYASYVRIIEAKINNKIIGWALICATPDSDIADTSIYVDDQYRRMGVGTNLTRIANQYILSINKKPEYRYHDLQSKKFFNSAVPKKYITKN